MNTQYAWFYNAFCDIFAENSPYRQVAVEKYVHSKDFTDFIIGQINRIISDRGCTAQNEYFRIDAMGYQTHWQDLDKISAFNRHLWDLEIAVEHENDSKDWLDEVMKLAHICCPLRVVIGYVPARLRDHLTRGDARLLRYTAEAIQKLKCANNLKQGTFMIILGNCRAKSPQEYFHYRGYVLNPETFTFEPVG